MVAEKMNGEIGCTSKVNKGTLISFYITVKCSQDDQGLSQDDHQKYLNTLNNKILLSQKLIQNLYMEDE